MRKIKEDAELTKKKVLDAAFDCFYNKGFGATTLEEVARSANLTRGAVYWHFSNKEDLYRQVVNEAYKYTDIVTFAKGLSEQLSFKEKLIEVFTFVQNEYKEFMFIYKTIAFVSQNEAFADLMEEMRHKKVELLNYFISMAKNEQESYEEVHRSPKDIGVALFLMFEGLFLLENMYISIPMSREDIERYISLIIDF